ncbi:uncharacterized protein LOC108088684 [Drosophila ficusphila]|uniref:uncharacterized protein LOC108088684 n=1 Tax=Drosophila ficusphila TaxID=30025 RepID=UPI0007E603C0|nr:uncharacterized protein LOC108088684 [Drosophila ficusphila]
MFHRGTRGCVSALIFTSLCLGFCRGYFSLEVGDPCPTPNYRSRCQPVEDCETLASHLQAGRLTTRTVMNCGFTSRSEKICCPVEDAQSMVRLDPQVETTRGTTSTTSTTTTSTTTTTTSTTTTTTTTTPAPEPWLNIFKTDRDYVEPSVGPTHRPTRDSTSLRKSSDGDECVAPLYEGQCRAVSECSSVKPLLDQGRLRDEDFTTCENGVLEEIICCPLNLPLQPRVQTVPRLSLGGDSSEAGRQEDPREVAVIARADALLPLYRHLASLAHPNAAFDGHLHHCAALVLTPRLLVSAAGCEKPSHAVFGVADMRDLDADEDYLADIVRLVQFRRDLSLIRLEDPLRLGSQTSANVSLAPICSQFELTRLQVSGSLVAVAWGKGEETDCPLYEMPMRLRPTWVCGDLANYGGVQELGSSHLCLEPMVGDQELQRFSNSSTCQACPGSVGSVLHLVRPGGSRCALGIATPTGADCEARAMYFTGLLSPQFRRFVEQEQRN